MSDVIFPDSILLGDLLATHPEYNLQKIEKHRDLYEGGDSFHRNIDRYLLKLQDESYDMNEIQAMYFAGFNPKAESHERPGEWQNAMQRMEGAKANYGKQWSARKARAWYPPIVAGLIDFMMAAIFQNPPVIVPGDNNNEKKVAATATTNSPEKQSAKVSSSIIGETIALKASTPQDYWHKLNLNCDGRGSSLREFARNTLLELFLNGRAYLSICFPENSATEFDAKKNSGGLDAQYCLLKSKDVDDWFCDDSGLVWIRTHRCTYVRSSPDKQPDIEQHCWTYVTDTATYEYEYSWPKDRQPNDSTIITRTNVINYDTGMPVLQIPCPVFVMERLSDIVLGLFNRQASLSWHLDKAAFALLVCGTKRQLQTIVDSTLGAVRVDPGDKIEFVSPDMQIPDRLLKDIERWKDELFSAVQAMVLQAASKDSGDRASGVAKQRDFGALSTLLTPFAMTLKESLKAIARKIQTIRRDDTISLTMQGLDKFDVQSTEMKLANVAAFLGLPNAPKTGKRFAIADATLAMMSNAPTAAREAAIQEVQNSDMETPQPIQQAAQPADAASTKQNADGKKQWNLSLKP